MLRRSFLALATTAILLPAARAQAEPVDKPYTWIFIEDMHCEDCCKKIARKLYAVPGVVKVQTHLEKNFAVVTPQEGKTLSPKALWTAVEKAEFKPVRLQGPSGEFKAKPQQ